MGVLFFVQKRRNLPGQRFKEVVLTGLLAEPRLYALRVGVASMRIDWNLLEGFSLNHKVTKSTKKSLSFP